MGSSGTASGSRLSDAEMQRAGRHLAEELGTGAEERFGAGMSIDQAIARLDGAHPDIFNQGIIWDAVSFGDEREMHALAGMLLSHGIRCVVHDGKLVFRHADVRRILVELGYMSAEDLAAQAEAEQAAEAAAPRTYEGTASVSVETGLLEEGAAPAPAMSAAPAGRECSEFRPIARALSAREEERERAELDDESAVERLQARAAAKPGHALSAEERAELLEHLASMADERRVPTLASPLRVPEAFSHLLGFDAPAAPRSFAARAFRISMQLLLIYAVCLTGEKIAALVPIGIPGNIVAMVLLLVFLLSGVIRMESISLAADFLLDHMAVFFVPAAVSIMGSFDLIAPNLAKLLAVCLITTVLVFFVTSFTVATVMNVMAKHGHGMPVSASPAESSSSPKEA